MADILVDPITISKQQKPYKKFIIPIIAALLVVIVGLVYIISQAYTVKIIVPKVVMNQDGFYSTRINRPFTPRGANFTRLAQSPSGHIYHSTFEPGQYKPQEIQHAIAGLKNAGYNTVRIFIDYGEFTSPSHGISTAVGSMTPIKPEYIANVADFIKQAAARGMYVIPVVDGIPANTFYYQTAGSPGGNILGNNVLYMDPRYVAAKEKYMSEFIIALYQQLGPSHGNILAYQTDNEVFFDASHPPFNTMTGNVTGLDGLSYDLSKPDRRQQAMDASLVVYSARMKKAIASADPSALFTIGFFTNYAVQKTSFNGGVLPAGTTNFRVPGRPAAVSIFGQADFIDMHVYSSGPKYSLQNDLATSEYPLFKKPYILGEFGTQKAAYNYNVSSAAVGMKNLQINSCTLKAKGWLFWTWDTGQTTALADQATFYTLADNNGAINGQLAPIVRPDPCR